MSLILMNLSQTYPTIRKSDFGNAFQLAPLSSTILLSQASTIPNTSADGNGFNVCNLADNLAVHLAVSFYYKEVIGRKVCWLFTPTGKQAWSSQI